MRSQIYSFDGYCPNCDQKIATDASFCQHCGTCLIGRKEQKPSVHEQSIIDPLQLNQLFESTTNLFTMWLSVFLLTIASGIYYHFYHHSSPLIITGVIFFYTWIFLTSKMDELSLKVDSQISKLVYLGLLVPVLGTIFCYFRLSNAVKKM